MKKCFCIYENKGADQLTITAPLISALVFATQVVQSLYFLNQKCQASGHLLCLYSPVSIGPDRKPHKTGFLVMRLKYSTVQCQKAHVVN